MFKAQAKPDIDKMLPEIDVTKAKIPPECKTLKKPLESALGSTTVTSMPGGEELVNGDQDEATMNKRKMALDSMQPIAKAGNDDTSRALCLGASHILSLVSMTVSFLIYFMI